PKNLTPVCPQNLRSNLAKEPQADDAHELAKSGTSLADTLDGDGSQRGKRRGILTNRLRHFDHQILRYCNDSRVRGVAASTACDPVSGFEPSLRVHGGEDCARGAVS